METSRQVRYFLIAAVLLLGVWWAFASAAEEEKTAYPNGQFLITGGALKERLRSEPLVIIDVRADKYFDGKMIPGAIRLPWTAFRQDSAAANMGGLFVGADKAQEILGRHGVFRNDRVVLYDSVKQDGGATASYVFWVLDLLGHQNMALLERGLDGWLEAGGEEVNQPREREPLLYQAPADEIRMRRLADEHFIYPRLGDPYYQILDVRSREEYLGETLNTALDGTPLKAGHIPGAFNVNYQDNWTDPGTKALKSYAELAGLYHGLAADQAVITYCHSARRSSFSYFVLRLMGLDDVILYENSWFGWGHPDRYYPVETVPRAPSGQALPARGEKTAEAKGDHRRPKASPEQKKPAAQGYISCGG
jgi:thiosulfate/3-mercaptopyruvate sulfurtransferase